MIQRLFIDVCTSNFTGKDSTVPNIREISKSPNTFPYVNIYIVTTPFESVIEDPTKSSR